MRINVLQHTPNEGPGSIQDWADENGYEGYIYHPYQFGKLPTVGETDMLVILGGPMSPNDDLDWIKAERNLIKKLLVSEKPMVGVCYGAQQITKTLGYPVSKAPYKEVGWTPVYRQSDIIPGLPEQLMVLHWHEEMFDIPAGAVPLFRSSLVENQGFLLNGRVLSLQFHLEPKTTNVREMVVNDGDYALDQNDLQQTGVDILAQGVPVENQAVMTTLLDYITK